MIEFKRFGAMAEQLGSGLQNRVDRCNSGSRLENFSPLAEVAELAGATALKAVDLRVVWVRIPPSALFSKRSLEGVWVKFERVFNKRAN